jgi:hypothetical protein
MPRKANKWIRAVKEWNAQDPNKGTYCVPKKGSSAYDEVKKIMNRKLIRSDKPKQVVESVSGPEKKKRLIIRKKDSWLRLKSHLIT